MTALGMTADVGVSRTCACAELYSARWGNEGGVKLYLWRVWPFGTQPWVFYLDIRSGHNKHEWALCCGPFGVEFVGDR